ncbi:hypothetical protein KAZ93_01000 [Patescibacteria group bacterium]|nr:hypothetical protein [Patescibacteria group bacterium]
MITSSWSGTLSVPGSITTGDGVISFTASGYIDTRWLGSTSSLFDNPYQRVMVDRRFIRQ